MLDALRRRGIACDIDIHPATGMAIILVHEQGRPARYVMFYDALDCATQLKIAIRVAAFFRKAEVLIDMDNPRDPDDRALHDAPIGDDVPCALGTRIMADLIAVTGRSPDTITFNDDGALDQMARLYVEAGGRGVARYVGTAIPWEEQRDSSDILDWIDRLHGLDAWLNLKGNVPDDPVRTLDDVRALCDRVVERLRGPATVKCSA